ncbi:hypothetical protein [Cronobacter malonaticus]|uniref:Ead/Ea22-like family protein n=1 Tax=Cronobacter malonaticus TaxID=413503 RepID=A0ABX5JZR4_9ENTR|nr:hypothetical protein [Cronobacter malonaticus]PUX04045.1 hypothetical protein AUM46_14225 [Cronobacter malonaticus]PUX11831.1 hypothetical protein AUN13_08545 [Cronobacter malonaticus]
MNNDELIAAGHELAKCLDSNTPLLDIVKLLSKMATQLDVTTAALREKTKQCEQLAAENAALKAFGDKLDRMHNDLNGEGTGIQGRAEVACQQIAIEAAMEEFEAIETPATDAFLRELRASELDSLCGVAETMLVKFANQNASQITEAQGWEMIRQQASKRAAKLRQGGAA